MRVFVDTGAFCALVLSADAHNATAKTHLKTLQEERYIFCTSDYVLDETYTLIKARGGHAVAVEFMRQQEKDSIELLPVSEDVLKRAKSIFMKFDDRRLSFTDCVSFALINKHRISAVFSFDDHFRFHPFTNPVRLFT